MLRAKRFFFTAVFATFIAFSYANVPKCFNDKLSSSERNQLSEGKTVIRNLDSYKKLSIVSSNPAMQKALNVIKNLKPAYVAEIIQLYPYEENENFLDTFSDKIMDIESYVGIPYYSERAKEWYDLYSSVAIVSSEKKGENSLVLANMEMEPFGVINTRIETEQTADTFYYISTNLNQLRYYDKFNCVGPEKMKSVVVIFKADNQWVLYGVGAVNAPSIFFLRDRVETSFMNRIKTFCAYFFKK